MLVSVASASVTTPAVHPLSAAEVLVVGTEALFAWREKSRVLVPGYEYSRLYERGLWDGTWAPGKWCRMREDGVYELRCSRGLQQRALAALDFVMPPSQQLMADALSYIVGHPRYRELRDYQKDAFVRAAVEGWGRIAFATNAGKGAVIALLADFARLRGEKVLICCDEVAVYDALLGELKAWTNCMPGLIKAGAKEPTDAPIHLAMIPTLALRLKLKKDKSNAEEVNGWRTWVAQHGMLLLDEADKATADTWKRVTAAAKGSRWRVGFSGTFPAALSYDDWRLEEFIGPVLASQRNMALVERGISARPTVTLAGFDATLSVCPPPRWDDWKAMTGPIRRQWAYEKAIVYNLERHRYVLSLIRPDVPTAIVINRIDHGEQLSETIPGSVFLDGSDSENWRIKTLDEFRAGTFKVLIVTKILDRGTNRLGYAQDVIFASGEGSDRQTLQRIGRGLRRADGKAELRVVDVIDRVEVGEDATDHASRRLRTIAGYLHRAGRSRVDLYEREGFDVEVAR